MSNVYLGLTKQDYINLRASCAGAVSHTNGG